MMGGATVQYKPYPAYKPSGVDWLGDVPEHWEPVRADGFCRYHKVQVSRDALDERDVLHYSIPIVQQTGSGAVEDGSTIDSDKLHVDRALLLISKLNPRKATIAIAKPSPEHLTVCSTEFVPLEVTRADLRFVSFIYLSEGVRQTLSSAVESATKSHQRVNPSSVAKLWCPFPPLPEQAAIADFLDRETGRIDALIEKKRRLIELLEEKRSALISHAVTKGLDPNVPMKDSGIEWLGQIPAHWEVKRLKHLAKLQSGVAKGRRLQDEESIRVPYLRVANVQDGFVDLSDVAEIAIPPHELQRYSLQPGDVLMNEGGDNDKLGRGTVWGGQIAPCIHQNHVFALRPREVEPEWIALSTQASYAKFYFYLSANQSTNLASISSTRVKETPLVLPPVAERRTICCQVRDTTGNLDALVLKNREVIDKLQEYRMALISAAVTGKIDVRGEVGA